MAGRRNQPDALKAWFLDVDSDRNGMLTADELANFLRKGDASMSDKQIQLIFDALDTDNSGEVNFSELVDFVFNPASTSMTKAFQKATKVENMMTTQDIEVLKADELSRHIIPTIKKVEFHGAKLLDKVDGVYSASNADWITCACAGASEYDDPGFNNRPFFQCSDTKLQLFFAWMDSPYQQGWFLAAERPGIGHTVTDFLMFNHSPNAETPADCTAPWEFKDYKLDKRLFCEGVDAGREETRRFDESWDGGLTDNVEDEELWPYLDELELDWDAIEDSDSDKDWDPQEAEEWPLDWDQQEEEEEESEDEDAVDEAERLALEAAAAEASKKDASASRRRHASSKSSGRKSKSYKRIGKTAEEKAILFGGELQHAPGFSVVGPKAAIRDCTPMVRTGDFNAPNLHEGSLTRCPGDGGGGTSSGKDDDAFPRLDKKEYAKYKDGDWIDRDFPPHDRSKGDTVTVADAWMRLSMINTRACLIYRIDTHDAYAEENAANMWFLSAIAAVSEYPSWIQSIFGPQIDLSPNARYVVRLFHPGRGAFVRVTIDDFVPCKGQSSAFAGISGDGEIWAALIEKAFAKLCGSFANSEWGETAFGMHYLCGGKSPESWERVSRNGPSRWRKTVHSWNGGGENAVGKTGDLAERMRAETKTMDGRAFNADELWGILRRYMERCFPVACGADPEKAKSKGLLTDRLYSIIGAREVPCGDLALRMVSLRNPFGVSEWTGRWSDGSKAWEENPSITDMLQADKRRVDGTFWMAYPDFLEYFNKLSVCRKSMPVQGCNQLKYIGLKRSLGIVDT